MSDSGEAVPGAPAAPDVAAEPAAPRVPLGTVLREWGRIGCIGFGGPPTHIKLLRELCVQRKGWLDGQEFEDAIAVCNLLPGPASTQLAIFCAWRLRGRLGALIGGAAFIIPGLIVILALSALFLAKSPRLWVLGAGAGAGAAVPAVAVNAGTSLIGASWQRRQRAIRWLIYLAAGVAAAATIGVWLVFVLLGCGLIELSAQLAARGGTQQLRSILAAPVAGRGRGQRRGPAVGGVGGIQGRRPVLRRRVRDHPAHAGRRGRSLSLAANILYLQANNSSTLYLDGASTYAGKTVLKSGPNGGGITVSVGGNSANLAFNKVTSGSASSNLGHPTTAANGTIGIGDTTYTSTLIYTGAGETTDRAIDLAGVTGGATLQADG